MDLKLSGKRAIVSGSTSGLGLACALALAAEGADVAVCGRDEGRLAAALERLESSKARESSVMRGVSADVTTTDGRRALVEVQPDADILVTNISGPPARTFFDTTADDWSRVLAGQLMAPLELIRDVAPGMRERRFGRILNITSAMVLAPRPHHVLSAASRTALTAAAKAISFELAPFNVTINNVLPERVDTPRQEQMARAAMVREGITYEQSRADQVRSIAANRLGRPDEFGSLCAFLCSADAGYISGQNIRFDGGSSPSIF